MAVLIVFLACFVDCRSILAIGERPLVLRLGQNAKQAAISYGYVAGIIESTPLLAGLVKTKLAETLSLTNGVDVEIRAASLRGLRGITAVAIIADEIAFWYSDDTGSANPDSAILDAVRPSLATTGGPLIAISSPYARRGEVFETWKRHFRRQGRQAHPGGARREPRSQSVVASIGHRSAMERDPASAAAEYLANFRTDIESFVSREAVAACVDIGCFERPPLSRFTSVGFVDPSGGSADSFTLAISHREKDGRAVLDLARERQPPFSPADVVSEFAATFKSYRCATVTGDKYAGEFPRELFRKCGVMYRPSERSKSELYVEVLPAINSRRIVLLDDRKAVAQLVGLERRTARSGKDSIDDAPGGHDDLINAVAGSLVLAAKPRGFNVSDEVLALADLPAAVFDAMFADC